MAGNGEKSPRNFDKARRKAREAANEAVGNKLHRIVAGAGELEQVLDELKLQDEATYRQLTSIVRAAAGRNESIGQFTDRLKAIGEVGSRLAENAAGLTPVAFLKVLAKGEVES